MPGSSAVNMDDARLIPEETPDGGLIHFPYFREGTDGIMRFANEHSLLLEAICVRPSRGTEVKLFRIPICPHREQELSASTDPRMAELLDKKAYKH